MPKKSKPKSTEPQVIPNGTFCLVKRPNLWANRHCVVRNYEGIFYRATVTDIDSTSSFQIHARLEELEPILSK